VFSLSTFNDKKVKKLLEKLKNGREVNEARRLKTIVYPDIRIVAKYGKRDVDNMQDFYMDFEWVVDNVIDYPDYLVDEYSIHYEEDSRDIKGIVKIIFEGEEEIPEKVFNELSKEIKDISRKDFIEPVDIYVD
jgi:hypothetical protein